MEASGFREDHPAPVGAGAELTEIDPIAVLPRTPWQLFWQRFREDKLALAALVFIVLLILVAIFAPVVVDIVGAPGPDERDTAALDPLFATPTGPSADHLFGVDQLGRDVFSRTVYGARVSLIVAFAATFLATVARASSPACSPATSAAGPTPSSRAASTSCSRSPTCCWPPGSPPPARSARPAAAAVRAASAA